MLFKCFDIDAPTFKIIFNWQDSTCFFSPFQYNITIYLIKHITPMGAVAIKQAKKHVKSPSKLNKNSNLVRCIFVAPL
jgi:hypothetical protein